MTNRLLVLPIIAVVFFMGALVSGCSKPGIESVPTKIDIPAETFQCGEAIERPSGEGTMESDVARYINSLEFNEKDCKRRLKEIQILLECGNNPKCDIPTLVKLLAVAKL
jgi:hypothetical protein